MPSNPQSLNIKFSIGEGVVKCYSQWVTPRVIPALLSEKLLASEEGVSSFEVGSQLYRGKYVYIIACSWHHN